MHVGGYGYCLAACCRPVNISLAKYTSRPPLNRQILQYQTGA